MRCCLGISFRRARRPADAEHPFGYGGVRFVWAFLAAIFSFVIGGCLSVGLAINDLVHGNVVDEFLVAWIGPGDRRARGRHALSSRR